MFVEGIVGLGHSRSSAFGSNGMAAHGIDLGNDSNAQARFILGKGDGGTLTSAATAYVQNVVGRGVHGASTNRAKIPTVPAHGWNT